MGGDGDEHSEPQRDEGPETSQLLLSQRALSMEVLDDGENHRAGVLTETGEQGVGAGGGELGGQEGVTDVSKAVDAESIAVGKDDHVAVIDIAVDDLAAEVVRIQR